MIPHVAFGIADAPRVVEHERRLEASQPGRVQLRPAAETCEEVRLDESSGDPDVGIDPFAVEPDRDVEHLTAPAKAGVVARVVVHDSHSPEYLGSQHRLELIGRVAAVGAGRDQHDDVARVGDALELVEHRGDHHMPRLRASAVAHRDRDRLPGPDALAERWPDGRSPQRTEHRGALVGDGVHLPRRDDDGAIGRHVDLHSGLAVREPNLHGSRCSSE